MLDQMRMLFNTAFHLVEAECPFQEIPALLGLQRLNGVPFGCAYSNKIQAKLFVSFIAEVLRAQLVDSMQKGDFFSISIDSSADKGNIDEEMGQVRIIGLYTSL